MKNNFINMSKRILISCLYNNHYYQEQIIKNH